MKKTGSFLISLIVVFIFVTTALSQSPDKILKQAAKALGSEKALRAVRSTQIKGKIIRSGDGSDGSDGSAGSYRAQALSPNLFYISYDINGFETAAGFNGKSGWQRDSREGSRTLTGDAGRDFQAEAAFHAGRWLNYKAEKSKISSGGQKQINGKTCNTVFLTTAKGVKISLYFDAATGLPVREEFPAADTLKVFDYADFRKVDGVMEPFSIHMQRGSERYEISVEEVLHNPVLARADFDFPKLSGEPIPDLMGLLRQVQANQEKIENILEEYTFTETSIERVADKNGTLHEKGSETNQITFYKGTRIYRLIEKNGKPLSGKEQEKEDKDVAERVAELEKKIARREEKKNAGETGPADEEQRVSIAEVLRASNLMNPRRERFRGREVIVFDFEPNPNFDYKNAKSILKFFGKTAGVIWIDENDKQVARMEAYLADSFSVVAGLVKLRKGASFSMEQDRINNEIWLPLIREINLSARVFLVKGLDFNQTTRFGNYKKFKAEVKDAKVDPIKDQ